eukprot:5493159-Alexandrium_andersonii.AAC.1
MCIRDRLSAHLISSTQFEAASRSVLHFLSGGLPPPRTPPQGKIEVPPAPCAGGTFWGVRTGGSPTGEE